MRLLTLGEARNHHTWALALRIARGPHLKGMLLTITLASTMAERSEAQGNQIGKDNCQREAGIIRG